MGYKTIAIEQSFDHSKKEPGKRGSEMFPEPHKIEHLRKEFQGKLRILQRLTILYVDVNVSHAMVNYKRKVFLDNEFNKLFLQSVSLNLRKFNLIAGQPKTDAALTVSYQTPPTFSFQTEIKKIFSALLHYFQWRSCYLRSCGWFQTLG